MKDEDFEGLMRSLGEARAYARGEPPAGVRVHVPEELDARAIRLTTGLTQSAFAAQVGVSAATLRNWEQGRRQPEGPARVLLAMLARDPKVVLDTLGAA